MATIRTEPRFNVLNFFEKSAHFDNLLPYNPSGTTKQLHLPLGQLPPFQIIKTEPGTWANIHLIEYNTGTETNIKALLTLTGLQSTEYDGTGEYGDYDLWEYPGTVPLPGTYNEGLHYLRLEDVNGNFVVSEMFSFIDGLELRRDYVKLTWWNKEDLILEREQSGGSMVSTAHMKFDYPFKWWVYLKAALEDRDWQYQEEVEEREGFEFVKSRTRYKEYRLAFTCPAYLADAISLIPLCDKIEMTYNRKDYTKVWKFQPEFSKVNMGSLKRADITILTNPTTNTAVASAYGDLTYAAAEFGNCFTGTTVCKAIIENGTDEYNNGEIIDENGTGSQFQAGQYAIVEVGGALIIRRALVDGGPANWENITEPDYSNWYARLDARPTGNATVGNYYFFAYNNLLFDKPYKVTEGLVSGTTYNVTGRSFGQSLVQIILKDASGGEWIAATVQSSIFPTDGADFDVTQGSTTATAYKIRATSWQCQIEVDSDWYPLEGVDFDEIGSTLEVYDEPGPTGPAPTGDDLDG